MNQKVLHLLYGLEESGEYWYSDFLEHITEY